MLLGVTQVNRLREEHIIRCISPRPIVCQSTPNLLRKHRWNRIGNLQALRHKTAVEVKPIREALQSRALSGSQATVLEGVNAARG